MDLSTVSNLALPQLVGSSEAVPTVDQMAAVAGVAVEAYGVRIGVRVDDVSTLAPLGDYLPFRSRRITQNPATIDRLFSIRTHPRDKWPALYIDGEEVFAIPQLDDVLRVFEMEAKAFVAEMAPVHVFVHAATLAWGGRALLIPGGSFSGKTTLAAELVRAGATYYSDEYAVIDEAALVHPYPRPLGLRKPGGSIHEWRSAEELGGQTGSEPIPIGLVVSAPYVAGTRWEPKRISAAHGLALLAANTRAVLHRPDSVLDVLQRAAGKAVFLESMRGDAAETATSVLTALQNDGEPVT